MKKISPSISSFLETKLNGFSDHLNAYIRANPNPGVRENIDENTLKQLNDVSRKLTNEIVLVSDGLFKITGHLVDQDNKPTYRTL